MFRVEVNSVAAYVAFDPARRGDLEGLDALIQAAAPQLGQYFHAGTPAGTPGMRFKMIGYGLTTSANGVEWPRVGVALQKNYISVYVQAGTVLERYRGRLGELRMGRGNFSFVRFAELKADVAEEMLREAAR
jgi:Domain of unknown function (DU1801)